MVEQWLKAWRYIKRRCEEDKGQEEEVVGGRKVEQ